MLPISAHVLAALPQAVGRPYRAEWSNDGGQTWTRCAIAAGSASVAADRTADVRYTAGADLVGVTGGRNGVNSIATNVRLWQGITLPRTDPIWFPAGRYTVTRTRANRAGTMTVELDGLEDELRAASFPTARTVGPGFARGLVEGLVGEALPGIPVAWRSGVSPDTQVPQIAATEDRWAVLSGGSDSTGTDTGIVSALAGEIWVDARGIVTIGPVPTLDDPVVWTIRRGQGGALVEPQAEQTAEGLANVWTITGDGGDGAPAVGPMFAWDDDPNSITYAGPDPVNDPLAPQRLGLNGVRLRVQRYASAVITTPTQASDVAAAKLADSLGVRASLTLTAVCNPALEPGDLVAVETDPEVFEPHLIDSFSYTLGSASMSCSTRTTTRRLT
ncbi:phage tail protein [Streptomyces europaeiscabiei]|uniref:Phage tail protein n=1 Tax=Streptomyces europaeiscabiei TaxID=146819 RepID=A0ABU4NSX1_9ACTN|nr:phage tail protein [Streptomyces europaeiscabiei]MDX3555179.1 phage tail protein [Streptomyces europaeiscabiei]MDX3705193.1 phage tail protein [Streptomyces europaeiscabiei]MDX3864396.1 phage tail protein [Streptomyces europaeiscabiei]MDX3871522.1 phage tail protein [Streptomyces europaeiscabiei]